MSTWSLKKFQVCTVFALCLIHLTFPAYSCELLWPPPMFPFGKQPGQTDFSPLFVFKRVLWKCLPQMMHRIKSNLVWLYAFISNLCLPHIFTGPTNHSIWRADLATCGQTFLQCMFSNVSSRYLSDLYLTSSLTYSRGPPIIPFGEQPWQAGGKLFSSVCFQTYPQDICLTYI